MATLSDLYGHLKTLVEQWCYNKSQMDTSLSGKVDKETGKGLSTNDYTTTEKNKLAGIEAQANKTVVDSALSSTSTNPLQNKAINTALNNKADSSSVPTKTSDLTNDGADGTNVFVANNDSRLTDSRTPTSHTHGNITNDGKVGSNANYFVYTGTAGAVTSKEKIGNINTDGKIGSIPNLPLITTLHGVITTGSFGNSAFTFCEGNDSRLSDARTPTSHNQATSTIEEESALTNVHTSANATQHQINIAFDSAIGDLSSIKALEFVSTLPTASSSTMGMLYVINESNKINFYYTEQTGTSTYAWHKMDTDILDELVVKATDVTDESGHTHIGSSANANQGTINGLIDTALGTKITKSLTATGLLKDDGTVMTSGTGASNWAVGNHTHSTPLGSSGGTLKIVANQQTYDLGNWLYNNVANSDHTHGNLTNDGKITQTITNNGNLVVTNSSNQVGVQSAIDVLDGVVQSLIQYGSS